MRWDLLNLRISAFCLRRILEDLTVAVDAYRVNEHVRCKVRDVADYVADRIPFIFQPEFCSVTKLFILALVGRQKCVAYRVNPDLVRCTDHQRRVEIQRPARRLQRLAVVFRDDLVKITKVPYLARSVAPAEVGVARCPPCVIGRGCVSVLVKYHKKAAFMVRLPAESRSIMLIRICKICNRSAGVEVALPENDCPLTVADST